MNQSFYHGLSCERLQAVLDAVDGWERRLGLKVMSATLKRSQKRLEFVGLGHRNQDPFHNDSFSSAQHLT